MEDQSSTNKKKRKQVDFLNGQHTIDSVKKDLVSAKERVAELESLLHRLQSEEEKKPKKLSSVSCDDDEDEDDDDNGDMLLSGDALMSVLEWLGPKDALACVQVCRRWQNDIDKTDNEKRQNVWMRVAENHSPHFVKAIEEERMKRISENNQSSPSQSNQLTIDYKHIATSLVYEKSTQRAIPAQNAVPQLNPKDVFLFVEARDRDTGATIGVWHKSFDCFLNCIWEPDLTEHTNMIDADDEKAIVPRTLERDGVAFGDHYRGIDPRNHTPPAIQESIVCSACCFRFDNGKSISWGDLVRVVYDFRRDENTRLILSDLKQPEAQINRGGGRILATNPFWSVRFDHHIEMALYLHFTPVIPSGDWQMNDWRKLTHRLDQIQFKFRKGRNVQVGVSATFGSMDELLFALDGLDWQ